jgi:hypothetical protein
MKDLPNPLEKAREAFFASDLGKACLEGTVSDSYLKNRLIVAFIAGWVARKKSYHGPRFKKRGIQTAE